MVQQHRRRLIVSPKHSSSSPASASGSTGRVRNASSSTRSTGGTGFFSWYTKQLDERPMTTKIVSSSLIAASGDVICQVLENSFAVNDGNDDQNDVGVDGTADNSAQKTTTNIDWYRAGRFFLIGAFWVAPATHLWYGFLSTRLIPGAATPKRVVQRLFLDQFGAAPIFCPTFMGLLWLLEGKPPSQVKTDLIDAGPTLVTSNWILWIPAMSIMFSVVPLKFQVVYSNFVGFVWTVYLSYASTRLSSQPTSEQQ
jgi:protein Mpv17